MEMNSYEPICWSCMNKYVGLQTSDGRTHDGFIAHVDHEYVTLAVPTNEMMGGPQPQGMGHRQFGYYPGFYPRRRFHMNRIPLAALTGLFLLPFFI